MALVQIGTVRIGALALPVVASDAISGEGGFLDGELLIGNSAGGLTKATLTAGGNITIANGDGSITIAAIAGAVGPTYSFEEPLTGATLTATAGLGAFVIAPAGILATLTIVLPPSPADQQVFEVSTSQTVSAFTATPAGAETVSGGGPFVLAENGGASWRYVESEATWFGRY